MLVLAYIDPSPVFVVGGSLAALIAGLASCFAILLGSLVKRHRGKIFLGLAILLGAGLFAWGIWEHQQGEPVSGNTENGRLIILGLDGLTPELIDPMLATGELPNLGKLKETGCYFRLGTTNPPQSPVAWTTFATGRNPGKHGVFDFIRRKPGTYLPDISLTRLEGGRSLPIRRTKAFWEYCEEAGVPATILGCPVTFPPDRIKGKMFSGMGVPDLLGTQGTFVFYTTEQQTVTDDTGGEVIIIEKNNPLQLELPGPHKKGITGKAERLTISFALIADKNNRTATLAFQKRQFRLTVGEWSPWIEVAFKVGPFRKMHGITRFFLGELEPHVKLYVSPINLDPRKPWFPVSSPKSYSRQLAEELGLFSTRGMPYDTWALEEGRISEEAFIAHAEEILQQRVDLLAHEIENCEKGVFFCYFEYPDIVQHMYWRFMDEKHPLYDPNESEKLKNMVPDCYRIMDDIVGLVLRQLNEDDTLMVLSDHGFTTFRRAVHLNTWLRRAGLFVLNNPADRQGLPLFENVDWSATRAYALGLSGIYLNLEGREPRGTVKPGAAADGITSAIVDGLRGLIDPQCGEPVFSHVWLREEIFQGDQSVNTPDIIVGTNPGWRISWQTALGGAPPEIFEDNARKWSGTHLVDPELVPGIFFCNRTSDADSPSLYDFAPTVLRYLGFDDERLEKEDLDGQPLF